MSSSSTLWATASKEWVIPSKPKPGRKPKKDPPTSGTGSDKDEADAKGRRVQNRAAQRAFRERKQSQLAELQARILSYEQGEIERNVALQNIAKRLKDENERLHLENAALKKRVAELEQQQREKVVETVDKKRPRDESPKAHSQAKKRPKASAPVDKPSPDSQSTSTVVSTPSSPATPQTPSTPLDEPAIQDVSLSYPTPFDMDPTGMSAMIDFSSSMKVDSPYPPFDCGFCSETTPCVCRDILNQFKPTDTYVDPTSLLPFDSPSPLSAMPDVTNRQESTSVLDNLPAYQPPVPLRKRANKSSTTKSIFPIYSITSDSEGQSSAVDAPTCSGDPSNCGACGDDTFGKAFCTAIEETVMSRTSHGSVDDRCDNCPSRQLDGSGSSGCCGDPMFCSGCPISPNPPPKDASSDYIPTNQAWKQIKAHPKAQFADLALLAEVVASRSKCSGPRIVFSPPPEDTWRPSTGVDSPRLVPQEILLECGRRRVKEVHSSSVRDALRLLDAKFT